MKKYVSPELEIYKISVADVIMASGDGGLLSGGGDANSDLDDFFGGLSRSVERNIQKFD